VITLSIPPEAKNKTTQAFHFRWDRQDPHTHTTGMRFLHKLSGRCRFLTASITEWPCMATLALCDAEP